MPLSTPDTILAVTGRRLADFAAGRGIVLEPLAENVGIDAALFAKPGVRISLEAFMRLLHLMEIISGDDCLGLRYGLHFQLGDSGAFGFALLHAPTLREALRIYRSYQRIVADHNFFDVEEEPPKVAIRWRYSRLLGYPEQYSDFRAVMLVKVLRTFLGASWVPQRVELLRPRPRSDTLHQSHFGPAVSFGAAMNEVSFASEALDTDSVGADPRLFEMMETDCESALAMIEKAKDLRLRVRERILAVLPMGQASLARVAGGMGFSERSLQRRLAELGTHFETLVEDTRRDLSDRLLATNTPLSEISYLCGYSNSSAYSRAARGWYGMAPMMMRQKIKGELT